jgi:hypothetical protein
MSRYKIGDKVVVYGKSAIIESLFIGNEGKLYDVRYTAVDIGLDTNIPEEDIDYWMADEQ